MEKYDMVMEKKMIWVRVRVRTKSYCKGTQRASAKHFCEKAQKYWFIIFPPISYILPSPCPFRGSVSISHLFLPSTN